MAAGETDHDRAQLWALYFGLRALKEPPPFLQRTREELRWHLESGSQPPPTGGHLRLVK